MTTNIRATRVDVRAVKAALEAVARRHAFRRDRRVKDNLAPRYLDQGEANCLVAMVLLELGFPHSLLRDLDRERPVGTLHREVVQISASRHPALRRLDPVALELLQWLQGRQDRGFAWAYIAEEAFKINGWGTTKFNLRRKPWLAHA